MNVDNEIYLVEANNNNNNSLKLDHLFLNLSRTKKVGNRDYNNLNYLFCTVWNFS